MSFLDYIHSHHHVHIIEFIPFCVEDDIVGYIHINRIETLLNEDLDVFELSYDNRLVFRNSIDNIDKRTESIAKVTQFLLDKGEIKTLRDEIYTASLEFLSVPLFYFDRALSGYFGIIARGVHINGYVIKNNQIYMWIAKRSKDKLIEPGKLDNIIAGGQPAHISLQDNIIKEGEEEAGFNKDIMKKSKPVGCLKYAYQDGLNLKRDEMFLYDLELTESDTPKNMDGEIESFSLEPIENIYNIMKKT